MTGLPDTGVAYHVGQVGNLVVLIWQMVYIELTQTQSTDVPPGAGFMHTSLKMACTTADGTSHAATDVVQCLSIGILKGQDCSTRKLFGTPDAETTYSYHFCVKAN